MGIDLPLCDRETIASSPVLSFVYRHQLIQAQFYRCPLESLSDQKQYPYWVRRQLTSCQVHPTQMTIAGYIVIKHVWDLDSRLATTLNGGLQIATSQTCKN